MKELPSAELLWHLYDYKPLTGELILKQESGPNPQKSLRYFTLRLQGEFYKVHRLIIKWLTGHDPQGIVEHKNDNGHDNRLVNLLDSTQRRNVHTRVGDVKGYQQISSGRYAAAICINGEKVSLGTYSSEAEAKAAYENAVEGLALNPNWRPPAISSLELGNSGYRFAYKHGPRFRSQYTYKGVKYRVGTFDTAYEASIAAIAHKLENHFNI